MISEERLPKYSANFKKPGQDQFFLYSRERVDPPRKGTSEPHSHNYYILNFLYEGAMRHFSDFEGEEISAPAVLILNIDQIHIHHDLKDCRIVGISFSSDFIQDQSNKLAECLETVFSRSHISLSPMELKQMDQVIVMMRAEYDKPIKDFELIKSLLNVLLVHCAKLHNGHLEPDSDRKVLHKKFREALRRDYRKNHKVSLYAALLNVTADSLNQAIKTATGKTAKQLIDERLLTEAKRLLFWSEVSIKELAWDLGFETDSYFNRFFKKHTGTTPKEFQKNAHKADLGH